MKPTTCVFEPLKSTSESKKHFVKIGRINPETNQFESFHEGKIFCKVCFDNDREKIISPYVFPSFPIPKILIYEKMFFRYSESTSSGTLKHHLITKHKIDFSCQSNNDQLVARTILVDSKLSSVPDDRKFFVLARAIALLCSRLYLSFHLMSSDAFTGFLRFTSILNDDQNAPSKSTISRACHDIRKILEQSLKTFLLSCVFDTFCVSVDMWTDNTVYRNPFININIHFIDQDWNAHNFLLSTEFLGRPHTSERIKQIILEILDFFGLGGKTFWIVADRARILTRAASLLAVGKIDCVLHGIHNLITTDLMKDTAMKPVLRSLSTIKLIQCHFRYRFEEIKIRHRNQQMIQKLNDFYHDLEIIGK